MVSIALPTPYPVGPVTVYLLEGDPPTLIDTGPATGAAWRRLCAKLLDLGYRPRDVGTILLTHGHHDHFGNGSRLSALGAEVMAHPDDRLNLGMVRCYRTRWRQLKRAGLGTARRSAVMLALRLLDRTTRPLTRFHPLDDGQELICSGRTLRVHHTPGHSPGHVAFELVGESALISGDTVLDRITPNAVVDIDPRDHARTFLSLAAYRSTLNRLAELQPRLLLPAHGRCLSDVGEQIDRIRRHQDERAAQVAALLQGNERTTAALVDHMFPGVSLLSTFLAYSEVLGHLLELERAGAARRRSKAGVDLWRLADVV